jgi:CRISPR-associated protein Cmr6
MVNINEIPLMFQAQISGRGQTQYIGNTTNIKRWVNEWKEGAENQLPAFISQQDSKTFRHKRYKITWRLLSNSGQDADMIRPVIAAGGFPYYPGASMKGAFLRNCTPEQAARYCGRKTSDNQTQPGIVPLRFHGGYPKDDEWKETELIDIVHPQQNWQIQHDSKHSAFLQISLFEPILCFAISSSKELDETEWNTIWGIWEKALEQGIGCRTSAGYGHPVKHPNTRLVTAFLSGQGLASKLIHDEIGEFRPNMFKAALRGQTLRLFGGVISPETAEELTRELWGGFAGNTSIVGSLGIAFYAKPEDLEIDFYRYNNSEIPTYELTEGVLNILCLRQLPDNEKEQLKRFAIQLIKFSMLFGGFGKSWRRVDHRLVYPNYLKNNRKPMIGCHWKFRKNSQSLYLPINKLTNITTFLDNLHNKSIPEWVTSRGKKLNNSVSDWGEAWRPEKVEVYARIAEDITDCQAVRWFHGDYEKGYSIKSSQLTGKMGKIGRIWHRMYPRYITKDGEIKRKADEHVEILTIFPDEAETTLDFLDYLEFDSDFTRVWKTEESS